MKNKKKTIIVIVAVTIVGIAVWLVIKRYTAKNSGTQSDNTSSPTETKPANSSVFPLKFGSQGAEVRHLQSWLNSTGSMPPYINLDSTIQPHNAINVDGIFGVKTLAALKAATGGMYSYVTRAYYELKNMHKF